MGSTKFLSFPKVNPTPGFINAFCHDQPGKCSFRKKPCSMLNGGQMTHGDTINESQWQGVT